MAHQKKMLTAKPDNLRCIPGNHVIEEENFYKLSSDLHMCPMADIYA